MVGGSNEYLVDAASLSDAVRRALEINEHFVGRRSDDTIVTLIEDGQQAVNYGSEAPNAKKRQWSVRVGRAREGSDGSALPPASFSALAPGWSGC